MFNVDRAVFNRFHDNIIICNLVLWSGHKESLEVIIKPTLILLVCQFAIIALDLFDIGKGWLWCLSRRESGVTGCFFHKNAVHVHTQTVYILIIIFLYQTRIWSSIVLLTHMSLRISAKNVSLMKVGNIIFICHILSFGNSDVTWKEPWITESPWHFAEIEIFSETEYDAYVPMILL